MLSVRQIRTIPHHTHSTTTPVASWPASGNQRARSKHVKRKTTKHKKNFLCFALPQEGGRGPLGRRQRLPPWARTCNGRLTASEPPTASFGLFRAHGLVNGEQAAGNCVMSWQSPASCRSCLKPDEARHEWQSWNNTVPMPPIADSHRGRVPAAKPSVVTKHQDTTGRGWYSFGCIPLVVAVVSSTLSIVFLH